MTTKETTKEITKKAVLGLVESPAHAETLVGELQRAGFASADISAIYPKGTTGNTHNAVDTAAHSLAPVGAIVGTSAGGVAGGALGLLAGLGMLAIPGIGPFIAVGPILSVFSGIAAGATLGGFTGALIGLGISEQEATHYDSQLKAGKVLLSVHVEDNVQRIRAKQILETSGAKNVVVVGSVSATATADRLIQAAN